MEVELEPTQVWGVAAPRLVELPAVRRTLAARATTPGAGASATHAADDFEGLVERLLAAASRQVRTLEQRVAPHLRGELGRIERARDEREREERMRARHLLRRGRSSGH